MNRAILIAFCLVPLSGSFARAECQPVRQFVYSLSESITLACNGETTLFTAEVPAMGRAVAYWEKPAVLWTNAKDGEIVVSTILGDTSASERIYAGIFTGELKEGSRRISVQVKQKNEAGCDDPKTIQKGSRLRIWVEDADPACRGKDIVVAGRKGRRPGRCDFADQVSFSANPSALVEAKLPLAIPAWVSVLGIAGFVPAPELLGEGNGAELRVQLNDIPRSVHNFSFKKGGEETSGLFAFHSEPGFLESTETSANLNVRATGNRRTIDAAKFCTDHELLVLIAERGTREEARISIQPVSGKVISTLYCPHDSDCAVTSSLPSSSEIKAAREKEKKGPGKGEPCTPDEYLRRNPGLSEQYTNNPMLHYGVYGQENGDCEPSLPPEKKREDEK